MSTEWFEVVLRATVEDEPQYYAGPYRRLATAEMIVKAYAGDGLITVRCATDPTPCAICDANFDSIEEDRREFESRMP